MYTYASKGYHQKKGGVSVNLISGRGSEVYETRGAEGYGEFILAT